MPNIDMINVNCAILDSMTLQLSGMTGAPGTPGDTNTCAENAVCAASNALAHVEYNEEQARAAYYHVYRFIQEQENGGTGWKPQHTELVLTDAPPGKGRSMWVSPEGRGRFLEQGKDAIKKIGID